MESMGISSERPQRAEPRSSNMMEMEVRCPNERLGEG